MIVLSGADIVLPDRVLSPGTLVLAGDHILDVAGGTRAATGSDITSIARMARLRAAC
jgi:hypothetical protein